jgi:hypothetical protein
VYGSYQGIALAMPEALRYECAFALRPESGSASVKAITIIVTPVIDGDRNQLLEVKVC